MENKKLSEVARHRRQVIEDVETAIAYVTGILTAVVIWAILHALGVM